MKPKTYLIDIDGVVLEHLECGASQQWLTGSPDVICTTKNTLDEIEAAGDMIVLVTARPEHYRPGLEALLLKAGVIYHKLVMGLTSGQRVIVNDCTDEKPVACNAVNVKRNAGFKLNETLEPRSQHYLHTTKKFPPGTRCYLKENGMIYYGTIIPISDKYPDTVRLANPDSRLFLKDRSDVPTFCSVDELVKDARS